MITADARARVARALGAYGDGFFLRFSRGDETLWTTDLPRRARDAQAALAALEALPLLCRADGGAGLWHIDLPTAEYARLVAPLPDKPPPLPADERLHPAYALCRLLLAHPAPIESQPMPLVRRALKLADGAPDAFLRAIPALHGECAALLRLRRPLPQAAGRALAQWLYQQEEKA